MVAWTRNFSLRSFAVSSCSVLRITTRWLYRASHNHDMITVLEARPVRACSAKVKRKLHFRVPRERMTSPPPLATSVLRPCATRGPKSHFLVKRNIVGSEVTEKCAAAFLICRRTFTLECNNGKQISGKSGLCYSDIS